MQNRQLWIVLAVVAAALAVGWALVEALCGAKEAPPGETGQPPKEERCVATITPFPYVALAVSLLVLALLYWVPQAIPAPEKRGAVIAVRSVGWTLVTLIFGFAILDLVRIGLFVLPFAVILLIVALWPHDTGRWAVLGGSGLVLLSAVLQYFDILYASYRDAMAAQVQHLRVADLPLAVFAVGGLLALVGGLLWPRWWAFVFEIAALGPVWAPLFWPDHRAETTLFILPGALLVTIGVLRSLLGFWVLRPEPPSKPTASDELDAQRA